jgi:hypothetical protein
MKKITVALCGLLFFAASACREIPPVIGECQTERIVLVEEFTGVRCVNCPMGSTKIAQLIDQYGTEKIIAISIHAGFFSVPYTESVEDFTTEAGNAIDAQLGPVTAYPAACINRKLFGNETQRPLSLSSWAGYIAAELCREPQININISNSFDNTSRQLSTNINLRSLNNSTIFDESLAMTVYITEDDIVSAQLDAGGLDLNYNHKHVLRHTLTDSRGTTIHSGGGTLEPFSANLNYTLPAHWDATKCHVVAFVHYRGNNNKYDVLQAAMAHF